MGVEYIVQLQSIGVDVDSVARNMTFNFSVGSDYFIEIAKLRAARVLWSNILQQFEPKSERAMQMTLHARTSLWNKTIYDPYVNILRSTLETMAATIGGAELVTVDRFDELYKNSDEHSSRLARNTQLIVKKESYLDEVIDPGNGSYYIEKLTDMLVDQSLKLFKAVEKRNGFIESLKDGFIQRRINKTRKKRDLQIVKRKEVYIGTNQFPNLEEHMIEKIDDRDMAYKIDYLADYSSEPVAFTAKLKLLSSKNSKISDFLICDSEKTDLNIKPLARYRGPQVFEEIRMKTEKHNVETGTLPKVFLLTIGDLTARRLRANFALNFFGCAGFEIIDNVGFKSVNESVDTAIESRAEIVVICSSDNEYEELAIPICSAIKSRNASIQVIIAGYPKKLKQQLEVGGIDHFIHKNTNAVETLKKFQKMYGIK